MFRNKGVIKSTELQPTYQPSSDHLLNEQQTTDPPTHRLYNHKPNREDSI